MKSNINKISNCSIKFIDIVSIRCKVFKVFNIYDKILLHAFYQLLENTSRATSRQYSATSCWMINHKLVSSNRVSKIKYGTEPWGSWPWREVQRPCDVEAGSRATCPGFAVNTRGVERDAVMHVSIQFWHEPWPYGMDNEKTEIR